MGTPDTSRPPDPRGADRLPRTRGRSSGGRGTVAEASPLNRETGAGSRANPSSRDEAPGHHCTSTSAFTRIIRQTRRQVKHRTRSSLLWVRWSSAAGDTAWQLSPAEEQPTKRPFRQPQHHPAALGSCPCGSPRGQRPGWASAPGPRPTQLPCLMTDVLKASVRTDSLQFLVRSRRCQSNTRVPVLAGQVSTLATDNRGAAHVGPRRVPG